MKSSIVKFGVIAGGFQVVANDRGEEGFQLTLEVCQAPAPIQWNLDTLSQDELEDLKEDLISVTRIYDKKMSEILGRFATNQRH
jgi:hypothetical protein